MSDDAAEFYGEDRYPSLRGAELMHLIMTEGPQTVERVRSKLGFRSRHGAWRLIQMVCLSRTFMLTCVDGRWGLAEQFQKQIEEQVAAQKRREAMRENSLQ